jgi:hypothetical protein
MRPECIFAASFAHIIELMPGAFEGIGTAVDTLVLVTMDGSFGGAMAGSFGVTMAGDTLTTDSFGGAIDRWMAGDWARASPAPANARHRTIDATAQAHEGDRNLASLAINLLDLPMDCSSEPAVFDGIDSMN